MGLLALGTGSVFAQPDFDNDGIPDNSDSCPARGDEGFGVDAQGCPYIDTDGDNVPNHLDSCPARGSTGLGVGSDGCPYVDTDGDGVFNRDDSCPANGGGALGVGSDGCPNVDTDGDGVFNRDDSCPANGGGALGVGSDGCPYIDTDADGIFNRNDACPANPNATVNGCPGGDPLPPTPPTVPQLTNAVDSDDEDDECPPEGCPPEFVEPPDDRLNWQGNDLEAVVYNHPDGTVLYCPTDSGATIGFLVSEATIAEANTSGDQSIPVLEAADCNAALYVLDNGQYQINIWTVEGKITEMISDSTDFTNAIMRNYDPNQ